MYIIVLLLLIIIMIIINFINPLEEILLLYRQEIYMFGTYPSIICIIYGLI